jgi:hypothetical protein
MVLFATLLPFAVLSTMLTIAPPAVGLFTAAGLVATLMTADAARGRAVKMLSAAALVITVTMGACALVLGDTFTAPMARLALDAGLLVVMLVSLVARMPFTIQYAREQVDPVTAARPEFYRANVVMTAVWCAAMVLMLAADLGAHYVPWLPIWTGLAAAFALRNGAAWFTRWYGARSRARGEAARATAGLAPRTIGDAA